MRFASSQNRSIALNTIKRLRIDFRALGRLRSVLRTRSAFAGEPLEARAVCRLPDFEIAREVTRLHFGREFVKSDRAHEHDCKYCQSQRARFFAINATMTRALPGPDRRM